MRSKNELPTPSDGRERALQSWLLKMFIFFLIVENWCFLLTPCVFQWDVGWLDTRQMTLDTSFWTSSSCWEPKTLSLVRKSNGPETAKKLIEYLTKKYIENEGNHKFQKTNYKFRKPNEEVHLINYIVISISGHFLFNSICKF